MAGCAGTFGGGGVKPASTSAPPERDGYGVAASITGAVAVSGILCDGMQTFTAAREEWSRGRMETGSIASLVLGDRPSPMAVGAYILNYSAAVLLIGHYLPRDWRAPFFAAVGAREWMTVGGNYQSTPGMCGI